MKKTFTFQTERGFLCDISTIEEEKKKKKKFRNKVE